MLVLAVDGNVANAEKGVYQQLSMVSFAVDRKQALLLKLAQARNCDMSLLLRNPEEKENQIDKGYDIDQVTKLLQDNKSKATIANPNEEGGIAKREPPETESPKAPAPAKTEMVKVPAAAEDIPAGTQITSDLIAEKFKLIELPKDLAADAVTDLAALAGDKQVLRTGLGKGQWVTKSLFGSAQPKDSPKDLFSLPKSGPNEKTIDVKKTRDIAIHTATGTKHFRYEEVAPDVWKQVGEVNLNEKPKTPPAPEKVD